MVEVDEVELKLGKGQISGWISATLGILSLCGVLCFLFPAVVLGRIPGMYAAWRGEPEARSDLHRAPGGWANSVLLRVLTLENKLIGAGVRLPWGSSVFAIARKPS